VFGAFDMHESLMISEPWALTFAGGSGASIPRSSAVPEPEDVNGDAMVY
jgi:hypothetical protein